MGDLIGARQSGRLRGAARAAAGRRGPAGAGRAQLAMDLIGADPALQRAENQRLRERAVARYPQGGGAVPGGLRGGRSEGPTGPRTPIRTPIPVACRRLRTSGSKGMLSGFGRVPGELPDEHRRGAGQRGLAAEEPAPRLAVVAAAMPGRAPRCRRRHSGPIASRSHSARSSKQRVSSALKLLVGPVVRPRGEVVHADRARGQHPLAVLDQRLGARPLQPGRRRAAASRQREERAEARARVIGGTGGGRRRRRRRACRRRAAAGRARPASGAGAARPRCRRAGARGACRRRRPAGSRPSTTVTGAVTGQSSSATARRPGRRSRRTMR